MNNTKKFSKAFVMSATMTHMLKSIDISIDKTTSRLKEFENSNDPELSKEVLETMSLLQSWKQTLILWKNSNPQLFM